MALIGNRSVLLKSPGRYFGGATVSDNRSNFGTPGSTRGRFFGGFPQTSATPSGYRPPYSWVLPVKPGELASVNNLTGGSSVALSMAAGVNGDATLTGAGSITQATGQLVISMVATLAGTGTVAAADLRGYLNAAATLSGAGTLTGPLRALAWLQAAVTGGGSVSSATPYATGSLAATIRGYSDLTPEGIRDKVWDALLANYQNDGSAGKALSAAGSGGVDYNALANAVWTYLNRTLTENPGVTTTDIVAALEAAVLPVDATKMNGATIVGDGSVTNPWRGEGVQP